MGMGPGPEKKGKGAEKCGEGVRRKIAKVGFRICPTRHERGDSMDYGHSRQVPKSG